MKGLEAVSWEHLVKKFVTFKLEKRSLGLGVGRRDTVAILGSWMGAGERAWSHSVEAGGLVVGPRVEGHHDGAAVLRGGSEGRSCLSLECGSRDRYWCG